MKLLLVGRKFGSVAGGVERMAILLVNEMHRRGHDAALLTWDRRDAVTHYPLDAGVRWYKLDMGDAMRKSNWRLRVKRLRRIRQLARSVDPDVVVAFQHGPFLAVRLALLGLGYPMVAAERNAPQRFDHLRAGRYRAAIFASFLLADRITVQLDAYREIYPRYLRSRIVAIPNPVLPAQRPSDPAGPEGGCKVLLFVGRLSYQKNPLVLLQAFARISARFPEWRLDMVGDGEDRARLEHTARQLGIADRVRFLGVTAAVEEEYRRAQLFCLPSRWEGFPNALAEAFVHGLPAVGFRGCAGVNALVRHGKNGLLAEGNGDASTLAAALAELMEDASRRRTMGSEAAALMKEYVPAEVFGRWERLLEELARGQGA